MKIKPLEVRNINQKEIDTIISHLREIDGDYFDAEIEAETRKGLLEDFTKVFVFNFGVYILSVDFFCINAKQLETNKNGLVFDHIVLKFFIRNTGECFEVQDDEFIDSIS